MASTDTMFKSGDEMYRDIVEKATQDAEFRAALLADPRSAIGEEFNINLSEIWEVKVHESKGTELHLALPPDLNSLDEGQLEGIVAGEHLPY